MVFCDKHSLLKICDHSLIQRAPPLQPGFSRNTEPEETAINVWGLSLWGEAEGRRELATAGCHKPRKKASHHRSNHLHKAESQPHAKNLCRNNDVGCCLVYPTVWTQLLHYWSLHSFTLFIHSSNGNDFIKFQPSELFRKTILDRALESSLPISLSLAIHQACQELLSYTAVLLTACYWRVNKI